MLFWVYYGVALCILYFLRDMQHGKTGFGDILVLNCVLNACCASDTISVLGIL